MECVKGSDEMENSFVCVDALCPSQQLFSHVGTFPVFLAGLNLTVLGRGYSASDESQTCNPLMPSLTLYHRACSKWQMI